MAHITVSPGAPQSVSVAESGGTLTVLSGTITYGTSPSGTGTTVTAGNSVPLAGSVFVTVPSTARAEIDVTSFPAVSSTVVLTQAQYDALTAPNARTLYVISG